MHNNPTTYHLNRNETRKFTKYKIKEETNPKHQTSHFVSLLQNPHKSHIIKYLRNEKS